MRDWVTRKPRQQKNHEGKIISYKSKLLKYVKVEDISRTTYIDHETFYMGIDHPYDNYQNIIVIWVETFYLLLSGSYLLVTFSLGMLANDGLGICFAT